MIAGPLLDNSTLVACLAAVGTVVKGWDDLNSTDLSDHESICVYHYAKP